MHAPHFVSSVMDLLAQGGYWLLFFIVLLEGLPLIGSVFPGHVLIISAGFFAKLGFLNLGWVLVIAIIAATFGDIMGYLLGRRYGWGLLDRCRKYFFLKQEYLEKAKKLIDLHTGKTIIFGKFNPITRPLIPFLVGASGVRIHTFWLYNLVGGILWVVLSVGLGYVFGASYGVAAKYFGTFILAALIISVLILWSYKAVNRRFHIFKKYELFMLGLNLLSLWALVKTVQDTISQNSFMANFDIYVNVFMAERITPIFIRMASWIGVVGNTEAFLVLGLIVGCAFLMKSRWRRAAIIIFSVSSTTLAVQFSKAFFLRVRPQNAFEILPTASFPSGHAALAAAFFIACIYVFTPKIKSWILRELFIVLCVALIIIIGLSRVVLNVHWASDVIAGWSLGIFLATSSVLFIRYLAALLLRDTK